MTATLDDQRPVDQMDRVFPGNAQPQVVILAGGQVLVEEPYLIQQRFSHHRCRGADQAKGQTLLEDHSGLLAVAFTRVDPHAVADPDLLGLTDQGLGVGLEKVELGAQLARQPRVIRIQQGDQGSRRGTNAGVTGGAHAPIGLMDIAQPSTIRGDQPFGVIGRTVIHHDQFAALDVLFQDRIDGCPQAPGTVVGG